MNRQMEEDEELEYADVINELFDKDFQDQNQAFLEYLTKDKLEQLTTWTSGIAGHTIGTWGTGNQGGHKQAFQH
jgi:hypothetical protein